jgi:toxin CcdB
MARLDIYRAPDAEGYLLDIQANFLSHLNTRLVVPLIPLAKAPQPASRLNPCFRIKDDDVVMVTQFMAAVPRSILQEPAGSLANQHDEIVKAVDFLMHGF